MKIFLNLIFITIIIYAAFSCDENIYIPSEDQPGRRDYEWSVDTLDYNNYLRMWASSPTDVWCTSPGEWEKSFAHFNGENWFSFGVPGLFNLFAIYGFSSNDVYVGGDNGSIWRFDGSSWKQFAQLTKNAHNGITFSRIWGESSNSFYATGAYPDEYGYNNSVIAQYTDRKWEMLNSNELYGLVTHLYKNFDNRIYLVVIGGREFTDSTHIYEYSQGKYYKLYSNIWTQGLQADITLIGREVYFVLGNQIAVRRSSKFQIILNVNSPNFYQRIWGRNSKDIFLLMTDGLAHYNGDNIEYLFYFNKVPGTQIFGAALFEKDVFFLVSEPTLNLIYHGKLYKEE